MLSQKLNWIFLRHIFIYIASIDFYRLWHVIERDSYLIHPDVCGQYLVPFILYIYDPQNKKKCTFFLIRWLLLFVIHFNESYIIWWTESRQCVEKKSANPPDASSLSSPQQRLRPSSVGWRISGRRIFRRCCNTAASAFFHLIKKRARGGKEGRTGGLVAYVGDSHKSDDDARTLYNTKKEENVPASKFKGRNLS